MLAKHTTNLLVRRCYVNLNCTLQLGRETVCMYWKSMHSQRCIKSFELSVYAPLYFHTHCGFCHYWYSDLILKITTEMSFKFGEQWKFDECLGCLGFIVNCFVPTNAFCTDTMFIIVVLMLFLFSFCLISNYCFPRLRNFYLILSGCPQVWIFCILTLEFGIAEESNNSLASK